MASQSALIIVLIAVALPSSGRTEEIPRTSWGHPDLRGTWDRRSITPFERPAQFGNKEFLTPEEVAEFEARRRQLDSRRDNEERAELAGGSPGAQALLNQGIARADDNREGPLVLGQADLDVGYNWLFIDIGKEMTGTMRTSLVVDPPDGRIPS